MIVTHAALCFLQQFVFIIRDSTAASYSSIQASHVCLEPNATLGLGMSDDSG